MGMELLGVRMGSQRDEFVIWCVCMHTVVTESRKGLEKVRRRLAVDAYSFCTWACFAAIFGDADRDTIKELGRRDQGRRIEVKQGGGRYH